MDKLSWGTILCARDFFGNLAYQKKKKNVVPTLKDRWTTQGKRMAAKC